MSIFNWFLDLFRRKTKSDVEVKKKSSSRKYAFRVRNKLKRKRINCLECGRGFLQKISSLERGKKNKTLYGGFCGRRCAGKYSASCKVKKKMAVNVSSERSCPVPAFLPH